MAPTDHALERAWLHVVQGRDVVSRQKQLIGRLEAKGLDAGRAKSLLVQFERTQAMFEEDLRRLERLKGP